MKRKRSLLIVDTLRNTIVSSAIFLFRYRDMKYIQWAFVFTVVFISAFFIACGGNEAAPAPQAVNGVLDLRYRDFEKNEPLALNGEWKFKWLKMDPAYSLPEYDDSAWETFSVPDYWNAREKTAQGYGWFRLRIRNVDQAHGRLGFFMKGMQTSGRIFVNGREVMADGEPGSTRETTRPGEFPQVMPLPEGNEYVVAWLVANFHSQNGGPRYAPVFGLYRDLARDLLLSDFKDALIIGFILMMAVYNFILWLFRRKEKASLFFALACLAIVVRFLIVSTFSLRIFWGADVFSARTLVTTLAILFAFTMVQNFLHCLFPLEISRRFAVAGNAAAAVLAVVLAAVPGFIETVFMRWYYVLVGLFGLWVTVALLRAVRRGRPGAAILFGGIILLVLSMVSEFIASSFPSLAAVDLVGFGVLAVVISYSAVLSYRFARLSSNLQREVGEQTERITEQKRELERLVKEKTDLFVNFSHETKTPLTLMHNYLEKYMGEHGADESLTVIKRNLDKLVRDVTNGLDLEKLIRNQAFYRHESAVGVTAFLKEKVKLFLPAAEKKGLGLTLKEAPPLYTRIDPFALDRILNNLLDNAVRYTTKGGKITCAARLNKGRLEVSIEDTGPGMGEEQRKKIFEPYYQISQKKGNLQGMGMGLAIVKRIMDALGGEIRVDSREGHGSRFVLVFTPCDGSGEEEALPELSGPGEYEEKGLAEERYEEGKDTLLVVEDNVGLLAYLQESLGKEYNVYYARSGREAVLKLEKMPAPQLILSDIMMDDMDGYEFLDALLASERYKSVPLVFLTARTLAADKLEGLSRGAVDVVRKPFSLEELETKIRSLIQNRKAQREALVREMQEALAGLILPKGGERAAAGGNEKNFAKYNITNREREIILLLVQGLGYKEISGRLGMAVNTLKSHVGRVYKKCGVQNKLELSALFKAP
jgi:signal transduction histidine kinase/DNA-binding NarL/FixJ family response regulator